MRHSRPLLAAAAAAVLALGLSGAAWGAPLKHKPQPAQGMYHPSPVRPKPKSAPEDTPMAQHFLVFQVSRPDKLSKVLALNNAANTKAAYGTDNVAVEIVAYGPGLKMLLKDSKYAARIQRMAEQQKVHFSACANTMKHFGITKDDLVPAANVVSSGVHRINELQEAGWSYIRP